MRYRDAAGLRFGIERNAELRELRSGFLLKHGARNEGPASRSLAPTSEIDIFGHRQLGNDRELLVHERDPEFSGGLRRGQMDDFALHTNLAAVRPDGAGKDFDQRRFSCAVLAEQRAHFPR